ncbi:hypothetical protein ABZS54_38365, partial [Embleya sp. NPDC005575]
GDRGAVAATTEGGAGAARGGIGRRGVLMTAGAAVVLMATLAAVVAMGSDSPDKGDHRRPVGSTGSAAFDPNTPNRGVEAEPKVDRDKPAAPTGSHKPGSTGATATSTTTVRETTSATTSAPANSPRSSSPANSPSQGSTSAPATTTSAPPPPSTTPPTSPASPQLPTGVDVP